MFSRTSRTLASVTLMGLVASACGSSDKKTASPTTPAPVVNSGNVQPSNPSSPQNPSVGGNLADTEDLSFSQYCKAAQQPGADQQLKNTVDALLNLERVKSQNPYNDCDQAQQILGQMTDLDLSRFQNQYHQQGKLFEGYEKWGKPTQSPIQQIDEGFGNPGAYPNQVGQAPISPFPGVGQSPVVGQVPSVGQAPSVGQVPTGQVPRVGQVPGVGQVPVGQQDERRPGFFGRLRDRIRRADDTSVPTSFAYAGNFQQGSWDQKGGYSDGWLPYPKQGALFDKGQHPVVHPCDLKDSFYCVGQSGSQQKFYRGIDIQDLRPIAALKNLQQIDLSYQGFGADKFQPVKRLPKLRRIFLGGFRDTNGKYCGGLKAGICQF